MTRTATGARYLAEALAHVGVTHVFFMDAILRRTLVELEQVGVKRILAHSEKAAAYMADGYARASDRVGVCMAQSVGAANLAAGLQDAYLHRTPVLAITGRKPPMFRNRNAYQEVVHAPLFQPVTKYRAEIEVGEELPLMLAQALRSATAETPRPVHLDVNGLQGEHIETATLSWPALPDPASARLRSRRVRPDDTDLARAAARIAAAERPIVVAGTGAVQSGAHQALLAFAETLSLPIATSLGGRGIIDTRHRLHVGVVGSYSMPATNRIVRDADLVVYVGCHTGDQVTHDWTAPEPGTPIVQVDVDAAEIGRNYLDVIGVQGDPAISVDALRQALVEDGAPPGAWHAWADKAAQHMAAWRNEVEALKRSDAEPIRVERLCAEITRALPADAVLVADTGYSGIWTGTMVELSSRQLYLRAAGSLGWSFPAALGAKLGAPHRPTVCFSGDGAFYYHLPELETARRWSIPVVVVVNNNSGFGQGIFNVRKIYEGVDGNPDEINRFGPTDFAEVARAFGVEGIRVERAEQIAPALERAIGLDTPVVVDVVTDAEARAPEAWDPNA